jgi:hypothetical protein
MEDKMNLKSMSIDKLVGLRDQVNAALSAKVIDQRRSLESELSNLTRFQPDAQSQPLAVAGHGDPLHLNTATPKILPRPGPGAASGPGGSPRRSRAERRSKISRLPVQQPSRKQTGAKRLAKLASDFYTRTLAPQGRPIPYRSGFTFPRQPP